MWPHTEFFQTFVPVTYFVIGYDPLSLSFNFSPGHTLSSTCPSIALTLSQTTNLDAPKLKEFVDDNFRIDENGVKFFKRVENAVGKGEIARYQQFLLFPQCFQKTCTVNTLKPGLVWESVKKVACTASTSVSQGLHHLMILT